MIRAATDLDVEFLREIERAAGEGFRQLGMAAVADDEPMSTDALRGYVAAGRCWLVDRAGRPAAYLIADVVDGNAHVEQVSVHPGHAHQRLGLRLLEYLARWSIARGYPAMTLTTFTDVPWNGPYYLRCGFRWLADEELTAGLRAIRAHEAAHGLDRWSRGCMGRELPSTCR